MSELLVSCPTDSRCKSFEFGQDGVGCGRPHERLAVLVVLGDEVIDLADQLVDTAEGPIIAALNGEGARIVTEAGLASFALGKTSPGLFSASEFCTPCQKEERVRMGVAGSAG